MATNDVCLERIARTISVRMAREISAMMVAVLPLVALACLIALPVGAKETKTTVMTYYKPLVTKLNNTCGEYTGRVRLGGARGARRAMIVSSVEQSHVDESNYTSLFKHRLLVKYFQDSACTKRHDGLPYYAASVREGECYSGETHVEQNRSSLSENQTYAFSSVKSYKFTLVSENMLMETRFFDSLPIVLGTTRRTRSIDTQDFIMKIVLKV